MTMQFEPNQLAAAELADRYIEIVLANKPELLFSSQRSGSNPQSVQDAAARLLEFRSLLVNGLAQQVVSGLEVD